MSLHPHLNLGPRLVAQALKFEQPADALLSEFFRQHRQLGSRERRVLSETLFQVLRRKRDFDALAQSGVGPVERRLFILAYAGERTLLHTTLSESEAQWLHKCEAVLAQESVGHNLPDWLALLLQEQLGADWEALAHSLLRTAPLDVRVNAMLGKRAALEMELREAGHACQPTPYSPWGLRLQGKPDLRSLNAWSRGAIEVQDEGSQLLALLVQARRGEMVADFCAGAGGKTLALGALMRDQGQLYAMDVSAHRLEGLKPRLERSGLSQVRTLALAHERDSRLARLAAKMDRVLVDAPCSGLGTLRRSPDLKWRMQEQAIAALQAQQLSILGEAAKLVKKGGRLVYATCSVLREENEDVARAFEQAHRAFQPVSVCQILEQCAVPSAMDLCNAEQTGLKEDADRSSGAAPGQHLRLWPHRHGTDGFFASVWQRV